MGFYEYRQNNSGGSWDFERGRLTVLVIVEASNPSEADQRAQKLGIYFDGSRNNRDCSCCGDRWYPASEFSRPTEVPQWCGKPLTEHPWREERSWGGESEKWMKTGQPEIYVHYLDGHVEEHWTDGPNYRQNQDED